MVLVALCPDQGIWICEQLFEASQDLLFHAFHVELDQVERAELPDQRNQAQDGLGRGDFHRSIRGGRIRDRTRVARRHAAAGDQGLLRIGNQGVHDLRAALQVNSDIRSQAGDGQFIGFYHCNKRQITDLRQPERKRPQIRADVQHPGLFWKVRGNMRGLQKAPLAIVAQE